MATTYQTPGVYVEEVDKGTKPIEVLGSSMPAFVGLTAQASHKKPESGAPDPDKEVLGKATLVTNWTQFREVFGGFAKGISLPDAVYAYFDNGGGNCYITSLDAIHEKGNTATVSIPEENPILTLEAKKGGLYGNDIEAFIEYPSKSSELFNLILRYPTYRGSMEERIENLKIVSEDNELVLKQEKNKNPVEPQSVNIVKISKAERPPKSEENEKNGQLKPWKFSGGGATKASLTIYDADEDSVMTISAKDSGKSGNQTTVAITLDAVTEGTPPTFTLKIDSTRESGISINSDKQLVKGGNEVAKFSRKVDIDVHSANFPDALTETNLSGGGGGSEIKRPTVQEFIGDEVQRTGLKGFSANEEVRLLVCCDLFPEDAKEFDDNLKKKAQQVQLAMIAECERLQYRFAILDTPRGLSAQEAKEWREEMNYDSQYAALYYPWIEVPDFSGSNGRTKFIPPSGIMAGVYGRVDSERGVHKAPANETLRGVSNLEIKITKGEQNLLNPIGINCIRSFPGRGIRVWGARTLSSDGSWRYINVRRLFITVAASLDEGLQWVVFEPNDRTLWAKVRRDINAFLGVFWLNGALFGATKSEAFYVKCDDELNPPAIRDLGQLIIEVGLSPVKPAEFVILRLSQWAGPNADAE